MQNKIHFSFFTREKDDKFAHLFFSFPKCLFIFFCAPLLHSLTFPALISHILSLLLVPFLPHSVANLTFTDLDELEALAMALGVNKEDENKGIGRAGTDIKDCSTSATSGVLTGNISSSDILTTWKSMRLYHSTDEVSQQGEFYDFHANVIQTKHIFPRPVFASSG